MKSNQEANAKFVELRNAFEFLWPKRARKKGLDAVNVCSPCELTRDLDQTPIILIYFSCFGDFQ